jgi:hypothetical protein
MDSIRGRVTEGQQLEKMTMAKADESEGRQQWGEMTEMKGERMMVGQYR